MASFLVFEASAWPRKKRPQGRFFHAAGGAQFHYIPCLNDNPAWIDALAALAEENLQGWL